MKKLEATAQIDQQIEKAKARLSALYAKRREIIAASKPHRPQAALERRKQLVELARSGADMQSLIEKTQLAESTIRYYLWQAIADEIRDEPGDYVENEFKLKKRLYPGIKWRKGGNYRIGSGYFGSRDVAWEQNSLRPIRYFFNDGSTMWMVGMKEAYGPFKE